MSDSASVRVFNSLYELEGGRGVGVFGGELGFCLGKPMIGGLDWLACNWLSFWFLSSWPAFLSFFLDAPVLCWQQLTVDTCRQMLEICCCRLAGRGDAWLKRLRLIHWP